MPKQNNSEKALAILIVGLLGVQLTGQTEPPNAAAIRPAMLRWRIGIERSEPPHDVIETISAVAVGGKRAWRVSHYPADPTAGTYDFYDVDASTLSPIRSVMKTRSFELSLSFDGPRVLLERAEKGQTASEDIALDGPVMPEGPGNTVFIAALPLRAGYTLKYRLVDRFQGKDRSRIKDVTLSVSGRRRARTAVGMQDVLEVASAAADGSFGMVQLVRSEPPHYPFRLEFTRRTSRFVSEVTTMLIGDSGLDRPTP